MKPDNGNLRIIMAIRRFPGSNSEAAYQALKRQGHSMLPVDEADFFPLAWKRTGLKAVRKLLQPWLIEELHRDIVERARLYRPHLFLAIKGAFIPARTLRALGEMGIARINWYPDVSFTVHSKYLPKSLPLYDWVFTTKTFGIEDMRERLGITNTSVLLHGYDPEIHRPQDLSDEEVERYGCDASFIGTWSRKKQEFLEHVVEALPGLKLRIWGNQWENALPGPLEDAIEGTEIIGREYAKAIRASKINIAILSEQRQGASSGDLITSRTFHIPASGGFMLHERTEEVLGVYEEGQEIACFNSPEELVEKIRGLVDADEEREEMARRGRHRCVPAHSLNERVKVLIEKYREL
jgi:hypothetical protein